MKRTYDVIGAGEGIAGLFASVLLAGKGLSCLWVDPSPDRPGTSLWEDTPFLLTESFFQEILMPVLARVDRRLGKNLIVERGISVEWIDSEDTSWGESPGSGRVLAAARRRSGRYVSLLRKSLTRPGRYLRELKSRNEEMSGREQDLCKALGSPGAWRIARLRVHASSLGMCSMTYGTVKSALEECLAGAGGEHVRSPGTELLASAQEVHGISLDDVIRTGHFCLAESPPGERPYHGFYLYGRCRAPLGMLPPGMGDLLIIPPPMEMRYPIILKVNRNPRDPSISVMTRAYVEEGLTSFTEAVSWASGMVVKRISRLLPFLASTVQTLDVVNPLDGSSVRPWFRFSEDVRPPSLFGARRYINPLKGIYSLDRDKYACLGNDGEFFWALCIANAILKDLGRSDFITVR